MPTFIVNVREVHIQPTKIVADTPQQAHQKVREGDGDNSLPMIYVESLNSATWTVEDENGKVVG